jgi:formate hydrogenlyase subunit 6/NADH:ubiquinone oxidoreductase subunit I
VETCPFFAIVMSDEHELATTDKSGLVIDLVAEKHRLTGRKAKWWKLKFRAGEEEEGA